MRNTLCCLLGAATLAACNEDPGAANGQGDHKPALLPKPTATAPAYPPPPYDVAPGSIIADYAFQGFANAKADNSKLDAIKLSDFYNPHAGDATYHPADASEDDRVFPPDSPYGAGKEKPTALFVDIAAVWCGPCNQEAKSVFPGLHTKYRPCGGEILFQLVEGQAPGTPPTEQYLRTWTKSYKVDYPATFDPMRQLNQLYPSDSFPDSAIIDTRTMRIVQVISGVPDDAYWKTYESLLDASCLAKP